MSTFSKKIGQNDIIYNEITESTIYKQCSRQDSTNLKLIVDAYSSLVCATCMWHNFVMANL